MLDSPGDVAVVDADGRRTVRRDVLKDWTFGQEGSMARVEWPIMARECDDGGTLGFAVPSAVEWEWFLAW